MSVKTILNRRNLKRSVIAVVCAISIWMIGDFVYSRITISRVNQWEATIDRNFDGVQVNHKEFEVGSGETAILMVHGINDSPSAFAKMAPALAAEGFHCRVIRLPGFAKPVPEYARGKAERWIEHVHQSTLDLKKSHKRVFVLAHSLGGATAIQMQLRHQPDIDGLILLAPAIEVSNVRSPIFSARFWHELGKRCLFFTTVVENPFAIDAKDKQESGRKDRNHFSPISVIDETFSLIDANRGRATEISVPTLMILTRDDRVIDLASCEEFFQQLGSENKQLAYNDRSGHALPYDFGWEQVVALVDKFIESRQ